MKDRYSVDISIIITAHHEGRIAHKTMLSVLEAASELDKSDISYEIIVSMDNPDDLTKEYYSRYKNNKLFRLITVSYGNVADSRNNAIEQSNGRYVTLLDGDDMISKNWFVDSYKLAETKKGLFILHPNIQVQFGIDEKQNSVWIMDDSCGKNLDAIIMVQFNRWTSALFFPREVINVVKYEKPIKGYGYEDYYFNTETTAKDILHCVTPKTSFYYRRMAESMQSIHITNKTVLPYTSLFDINYAKTWDVENNDNKNSTNINNNIIKRIAKKSINVLKRSKIIRKIIGSRSEKISEIIYKRRLNNLPDWLIETWKDMNHIDNQLWPTKYIINNLDYHPCSFSQSGEHATKVGRAYSKLAKQFTKMPDYMFFTYDPLGAGGTEKVLVNYINSLKKAHPDWHFVIIRKKPDNFPFTLPEDVDFVDFDGITEGMHPWEKDILFDRMIVQTKIKRLHCFFNGWANGDYTYNWVKNHKKFLKENDYNLYISWFMKEFVPNDEKGRVMTFADPYLGEIYDVVDKVFTDNQNVIDESLANNAYDSTKFIVHRQPMDFAEFTEPKNISKDKPLRVLWASRLSYQKRPDILRAIAEKIGNDESIVIDAYGREQDYDGKYLSGLQSLKYKGVFSGFKSLPLDKYDVFLYTSQVDGLPNVLLEASAAGLPIIASNDGGVSELIQNNETGWLVDIEDIDGYILALNDIKSRPNNAKKYVKKAQNIIKQEFTYDKFNKSVIKDIK